MHKSQGMKCPESSESVLRLVGDFNLAGNPKCKIKALKNITQSINALSLLLLTVFLLCFDRFAQDLIYH